MTTPRPARHLPAAEFQSRIRRLQALQKRLGLDAILLYADISRYYFTGLVTSNGLFLTRADGPLFLTDFRYLTMARRQAPWLEREKLWTKAEAHDALAKLGKNWRRIGHEDSLSAARDRQLKEALPDREWIDVSEHLSDLRAVKSPAEQRAVRAAVAANDCLFAALMRQVAPGQSEWEIRNLVRRAADHYGQIESFEPIVCVGKTAAECHHAPDETVLRRGQPLLLDLGLKLDHYCSDMTRCRFFGTPPPLYRDLFRIVQEANRKAIGAIRPGVPCCDIDAVARQHIDKAGYGSAFGHSLGHGIGLEVHESPNFSAVCKTALKPGMTLTVEPGIYLPGKFGIRIEDVILVTRTGCEVLTKTPHEV